MRRDTGLDGSGFVPVKYVISHFHDPNSVPESDVWLFPSTTRLTGDGELVGQFAASLAQGSYHVDCCAVWALGLLVKARKSGRSLSHRCLRLPWAHPCAEQRPESLSVCSAGTAVSGSGKSGAEDITRR